ncbi:MAG: hypothetical protein R3C53_26540 [Pirellulaceae bacterium]
MKRLFVAITLSAVLALPGCQPVSETAPAPAAETTPGADAHVHDHSHDTGPHGGHLVDLQPGNIHAEWTHDDDTHEIKVFLDDFDADKIQSAKFLVEIPEADTEEFPLTATDSGWTVTSEALMTNLNMGESVTVKLVVVDDSGEYSAKMEPHEHHHH